MTNWLREALLMPPLKCHFMQSELSKNRILFCLRFFIHDSVFSCLSFQTLIVFTPVSPSVSNPLFLSAVYSSGLSLGIISSRKSFLGEASTQGVL